MPVRASVNYHVTRPHSQAFIFDVDGIVGNLSSPELIETQVDVQDLRAKPWAVNFEDDGIVFLRAPTEIRPREAQNTWQPEYEKETIALLKNTIGAKDVIVFDHTLRIDSQDAKRQPARNVHNDFSPKGAHQRLIDLVGIERANHYQEGHFGFVNVWRPIENKITSTPLGFIRPSSMQSKDWVTIELIYPDRNGQILGVAANSQHEWFYQSDMQPDEAVIFNIYDNQGRPHPAHSALDISAADVKPEAKTLAPRKSLETRTLVRYA